VADPDKVTIYEVARRAGVSIATVSRVFNRPERVKSSTRERVLDVVDELGGPPGCRRSWSGRGCDGPFLDRSPACG